jgi:hypothetical protein
MVAQGCVRSRGDFVDPVDGGAAPAGHEMLVGVDGDLDRVVAELVADVGEALPFWISSEA